MATIDIIILAMIGVGVIMGLMKGFVKQMASIVAVSYTHLYVVDSFISLYFVSLALETEGHIQQNDNNGKDSKSQHTVTYHEFLVRI